MAGSPTPNFRLSQGVVGKMSRLSWPFGPHFLNGHPRPRIAAVSSVLIAIVLTPFSALKTAHVSPSCPRLRIRVGQQIHSLGESGDTEGIKRGMQTSSTSILNIGREAGAKGKSQYAAYRDKKEKEKATMFQHGSVNEITSAGRENSHQ